MRELPSSVAVIGPGSPLSWPLNGRPIDQLDDSSLSEWSVISIGGLAKSPMAVRLSCRGEPVEGMAAALASYLRMDRKPVSLERLPGRLDVYATSGAKPRRYVDVRLVAVVEKLLIDPAKPVQWWLVDDNRPGCHPWCVGTHVLVATQWHSAVVDETWETTHCPVALVACLSDKPGAL